jgi:hypothetical protein
MLTVVSVSVWQANLGVLLVVFYSFALAMVPLAMFIQTFTSEVSTANTAAFAFFIGACISVSAFSLSVRLYLYLSHSLTHRGSSAVGFLLQGFLSFVGVSLLYDPSSSPIFSQIFQFYAPFNFGKALYDVSVRAFPVFDSESGAFVRGPGFSWADMYNGLTYTSLTNSNFVAPPLVHSIGWLWIDFAVFLAAAWCACL